MNKLASVVSCLAFAAVSATAAISPSLLNLVMPDATILSGMNVDQSVTSPFGQYVLNQIQVSDPAFLKFVTSTGFDPRRDLHEILAATPSTSATAPHTALVLGRGTFQPAAIIAAATAEGGTVTSYRGFNLITGPQESKSTMTPAVVFLDGATAAMGDIDSVKAAIDRRIAGATYAGALATQATQVSANNSAWFATLTPLSGFLNGKTAGNVNGLSANGLLQAVQQASGGVQFGSTAVTVSGDAVTRSPQDAQALVSVMQFLVSMLQGNPDATKAAPILNSAQFTANGSVMHLSLTLAEAQIEELFMPQSKGKIRGAEKPRKPASSPQQ